MTFSTTPSVILPTHDPRDLEIARLGNLAASLAQEKSDALAKLQRVEVEASMKYELDLAAQKALTAQNVTHLEATLRDIVARNQEASFYVQTENQK
eukprot:4770005-Amphidinium_carterae.1